MIMMRRAKRVAEVLARVAVAEREASAEELSHSLTSFELEDLAGVPVMCYSDAFHNDEMPAESVIFLWRSRPEYGHWCAAWERLPGVLGVFDSYGTTKPDAWRRGQGECEAIKLGQEDTSLLNVALGGKYHKIEWNDHPLQAKHPRVTTCGRWCALRLAFPELDPEEFANACKIAALAIEIPLDDLVVRLTR